VAKTTKTHTDVTKRAMLIATRRIQVSNVSSAFGEEVLATLLLSSKVLLMILEECEATKWVRTTGPRIVPTDIPTATTSIAVPTSYSGNQREAKTPGNVSRMVAGMPPIVSQPLKRKAGY